MARDPHLLIIGLDCLAPDLVFERWRDRLPTFARLMDQGSFGPLRSVDPPITVPAWSCMFSGRDPGELGLYGFAHRTGWGPGDLCVPGAATVRLPRLWDLASAAGLPALIAGVPQTWPPPGPGFIGRLVSGPLCPGPDVRCTTPPEAAGELPAGYAFDLAAYRERDPDAIEAEAHTMTAARFALFQRWLEAHPWRLAVLVEIAVDRMHHVFWRDGMDRIERYYQALDAHLARTLRAAEAGAEGPVAVLVVSDHGAQALEGAVRINQWLLEAGLLTLREPVDSGLVPLTPERVAWDRTLATGQGGYCGRVTLNLRGRQPAGVVAPEDAPALLRRIEEGLKAIAAPGGRPAATRVLRPAEVYREVRGFPPDLIVYFDDLRWRALGKVGPPGTSIFTRENDTGPDGANHARDGVWIARFPDRPPAGRQQGLHLHDVFATAVAILGLPRPEGTLGTSRWVPRAGA